MEPVEWIVAGVVLGLVIGGGYLIYEGLQKLKEKQDEDESGS